MPYMVKDGVPFTLSSTLGHTVRLSSQPTWVPDELVAEVKAEGGQMAPSDGVEASPVPATPRKVRGKPVTTEV